MTRKFGFAIVAILFVALIAVSAIGVVNFAVAAEATAGAVTDDAIAGIGVGCSLGRGAVPVDGESHRSRLLDPLPLR
ncbi:MAG: hypothetical protein R2873_04555 [Caldilineaceae bacterium]